MTIHQAKGLEFPVVVVGSLSTQLSSAKGIDRDLGAYYHRPRFEPENRITLFDRMRLHYVAFSRPQKVLVLTSTGTPRGRCARLAGPSPVAHQCSRAAGGPTLHPGASGCPLSRPTASPATSRSTRPARAQYQFFREYDFTPSRSAVIFFGLLGSNT